MNRLIISKHAFVVRRDRYGFNRAAPSVLFLDLNSAFASIEQQYRPELRGKPVAVCPGTVRASPVISASREARALGVKTGMRVYDALPLCPEQVLVEPDPGRYVETSRRILHLLDSYSPRELPLSIDEAAVDLVGTAFMRLHGRTGIVILHRFSTVRAADKIAVIERGRLCERGSHDEPVAAGGRYAELFELQASGYR
jgi:nucleotidyltransferase/DNA polymerase involved in DNA repair